MVRIFLRGRTILCRRSVGLTTSSSSSFSGVGSSRAVLAAHHHPHYNLGMSIRQWSDASKSNTAALKRKKKANNNLRHGGASSGRIAVLEQGGRKTGGKIIGYFY